MLDFSFARRAPVILQSEAAECGLACLAMVAGFHGHRVDLATLRSRHAISLKGTTLADLMRLAGQLKLAPRPLRVELSHLRRAAAAVRAARGLQPLRGADARVAAAGVTVHDPAVGRVDLPLTELSRRFTGVALELAPTTEFTPRTERQRVGLRALVGRLPGLAPTLAQILVLALVLQVFAILAPFFMQWVVDQAIVSQDRDLVMVLGLGFLLLAVVQAAVTALRAWALMVLGTTLNLQLLSNLFRHLVRLPMSWFERRHLGDVVSRFESLNVIQRTLTVGFLEALVDGVMALATLAMMLVYSVKLAAVAVVAAALYGVIRLLLYRPYRLASEEAAGAHGQAAHPLPRDGARHAEHQAARARRQPRQRAGRTWRWTSSTPACARSGSRFCTRGSTALLFGIENVVTVWLAALLVLDGKGFSVGMLFAFVAYKAQFVQRVANLIEKALELRMLGLHTERVGDIALTPAEPGATSSPLDQAPVDGAIEVKGLCFRYAETDPLVLSDINLRIEPGESVAIVGPSGCGKTTLVKLLLGLLQPTQGSDRGGRRAAGAAGTGALPRPRWRA